MTYEAERSQHTNDVAKDGKLSADTLALVETIKSEGTAFRQEEAREDGAKKLREWITILLVACTLFAISWQVHEMVKVYGPIKDQAAALLKAAEAATKQAENSEKFLIQSQRAWVGTKRVSLSAEPKADQALDVMIDVENTGHEPALDFDFIILPHLETAAGLHYGEAANFIESVNVTCDAMPNSDRGFIIFPGATGKIAKPDNWTQISQEFVDDTLEKGNSVLSITGCLTYRTMGLVHHTSFCYWYQKGITDFQNLRVCGGAHNHAD